MPNIDPVLDSNSERAAEIKRITSPTNTSCSIISIDSNGLNKSFHVLVDIGYGVVHSLESIPKSGLIPFNRSYLPNALLLTHSHDDHVHDIDTLLNSYDSSKKLNIYCTFQCHEQIIKKFNRHKLESKAKFIHISPGQAIEIGPFTVTPFSVEHRDSDNGNIKDTDLAGCVIFVIQLQNNKKIIIGWDFMHINGIDQNLLWNPDLVILGTETYNPHPSTGMISVTEAYDFVRTWNAKECFIVHYGGSMDFEDGKNQWFRGPVKAMTSTELQNTINEQMKLTGNDGKFKMIVASEGQIWSAEEDRKGEDIPEDDISVGRFMEIESLQNYILQLENEEQEQKLHLTIEDRINRYSLEFVNPHLDRNNADILYGDPVKGMLAKGPELKMQIIPGLTSPPDGYQVNVNIMKGKKQIFRDIILIKTADMKRLKRFIRENFT